MARVRKTKASKKDLYSGFADAVDEHEEDSAIYPRMRPAGARLNASTRTSSASGWRS